HDQPRQPAAPAHAAAAAGEGHVDGEQRQCRGAAEVDVPGHAAGDEALLGRRAEHFGADRHDDAGVKREAALPEHQGGNDEEATEEAHQIQPPPAFSTTAICPASSTTICGLSRYTDTVPVMRTVLPR